MRLPKIFVMSSSSSSDSDEEVYKVEDIKGHKKKGNKMYYLIKWVGYPDSENTWEPESNLSCPDILKRYQQSLVQKENSIKSSPKSPKSKTSKSKQSDSKPTPKKTVKSKDNKIKKRPIAEIFGCTTDSTRNIIYYVVKFEGETEPSSLPSSLVRRWAPFKLASFLESHLNFS
ncbi:chromobox protein [Histomonas meleagridis]|uniref:chromobox protein n=1 Tax=Histomonas meleagridis TaxID=135588 RepID=UPI00355AA578|nr:chromobox protein [Histomonas meleagridis]KAH0798100.1 chromobox protein [Histomonas meleagridis]